MAYRKFRSADQPFALRFLLGLYEFLASLQLAVVLIAASTVVLVWSAFYLDSRYGTSVVKFAVYDSGWFAAINVLLGLNVLCAALIRFPWKKSQTGFLITHAGILVLLIGCLLTRLEGIDAHLPVFEGTSASVAFQESQHFHLTVYPAGEPIDVPFASGPFNWDDYRRLFWFPWRLARRDQGVLYDQGGIKLEVLDYYSNANLSQVPPLRLRVKNPPTAGDPTSGSGDPWQGVDLTVRQIRNPHAPDRRMTLGTRTQLSSGGQIVFWVAGSQAETEAFLDSRPEGPLGKLGQLVLHAGGKKFVIPLERFQSKTRQPLGDTGLDVELIKLDPRGQVVLLQVLDPGSKPQRMMLAAEMPDFDQQDEDHGVFGTYWAPAAHETEEGRDKAAGGRSSGAGPRIDILQGADQQLYYRVWKSPQVERIGTLPSDGARVAVLQKTDTPLTFYVEKFTPHDRPGQIIRPAAFNKDRTAAARQARVRLTVDGKSEEFWLEGLPMIEDDADPSQRKMVYGSGRRVAVTLPWDQVAIGFWVYLDKAEQGLDPGTSMPSRYWSKVDFRDLDDPSKTLNEKEVRIALNAPADFSDPRSGRSYRLFQADYKGPWKPGEEPFDRHVDPGSDRRDVSLSVLSVNYDPGRGLKYAGSLLITLGVAVVFSMRGHFFRRRATGHQTKE